MQDYIDANVAKTVTINFKNQQKTAKINKILCLVNLPIESLLSNKKGGL